MKSLLKPITLIAAFICLNIFSTNAQVIVKVRPIKPKVIVVKPAIQKQNHIWRDGHWKWAGKQNKYIWVKAHWTKKNIGHNWISGHWVSSKNGHKWINGYWKKTKKRNKRRRRNRL